MKKIAYLCLSPTREGRAEHAHVHEIVAGLSRRGWEVELFKPTYEETPGALARLGQFLWVQWRLWTSPVVVEALYIRAHFAAFPTSLWAKWRRIPVVQEINGPYEDIFIAWSWMRSIAPLVKWLVRVQFQWADAIVTVTPELKNWAIAQGANSSIYVIPNGANTNLFHPKAKTTRNLPKSYVLWFGSMAGWQGIDTLLAAVAHPDWHDEISLIFMGDGAERHKVIEAAHKNPKVLYLGSIPYQEVPGIITGSLAGLIPKNDRGNRSETGLSPLKVYETMACGVPVVVSDFPGQADLVRGCEGGLVVPPDDPGALAKAVAYLYAHPTERDAMGKRGREAIAQHHSWDQRAEATHEVLSQLVQARS